jgi:hypothetical protein
MHRLLWLGCLLGFCLVLGCGNKDTGTTVKTRKGRLMKPEGAGPQR